MTRTQDVRYKTKEGTGLLHYLLSNSSHPIAVQASCITDHPLALSRRGWVACHTVSNRCQRWPCLVVHLGGSKACSCGCSQVRQASARDSVATLNRDSCSSGKRDCYSSGQPENLMD